MSLFQKFTQAVKIKIKIYLPRYIGEFGGSNLLCIEAAHYNFDFVQNTFIFLPFSS